MTVECIEYASYFEEEVILNWSDVDDILLHQQSALEGLKENVEIGSKQFDIEFIALTVLLFS